MAVFHMGEAETRFADLIWAEEPVSSAELVRLAGEQLEWKKSTTYTVLRRLIDKGLFQNANGMVSSVMSKKEYAAAQSEQFVDETFSGSLPMLVTAFASRKKLSEKEIDELQQIIDAARSTTGSGERRKE